MKKNKVLFAIIVAVILTLSLITFGCSHDSNEEGGNDRRPTPKDTTGKISKVYWFFRREGNQYVFYRMVDSSAKKTGLKVEVEKNTSAESADENIYSAVSPGGKKVAYLQKPAWPHRISVASINGGNTEEVVSATKPTPTHAKIENSLRWSADGKSIIYSLTLDGECGEGEGLISTTLFSIHVRTKKQKELVQDTRSCAQDQTRTIMSGE